MKIISNRAKALRPTPPGQAQIESNEPSIIIVTPGGMTSEEIKRVEQIFRDIRKQLEDFGGILIHHP